jgi:hypothetical protein
MSGARRNLSFANEPVSPDAPGRYVKRTSFAERYLTNPRGFSSIAEGKLSSPADTCPMPTTEHDRNAAPETASTRGEPAGRSRIRAIARSRLLALCGGGTGGNEQLTAMAGVILIVLLAILGITILRIQQLISPHLFVGLLLLGPLVVKLASTGYRFARYYTHNPAYRKKGPPELVMRLIAPMVVFSTLVVFVSGIVLLFAGPTGRGQLLLIHKASFIVWGVFTGLHVLGHLSHMPQSLRAGRNAGRANGDPSVTSPAGAAGRWITLGGGLVGGLVLAIVLIPQFAPWTAHGAFLHHHH